jgi:DNA-binding response OmpR family regulator
LQRIRALSDVPVIVLIDDTPEARIESLDLGADFFLIKPPSVSELDAKVRALLRRNPAMLSGTSALHERKQELTDLNAVLGV